MADKHLAEIPCPTCGDELKCRLMITSSSVYCDRCGTIFHTDGHTPPYIPDLVRRCREVATFYSDDDRILQILLRFGILECITPPAPPIQENENVSDSES